MSSPPCRLCLQPPAAFDASAYSFFGDLSAADDSLEGALEVRVVPKLAMAQGAPVPSLPPLPA